MVQKPIRLRTALHLARLAGLGALDSGSVQQLLNAAAARYGLPASLVLAVARRESNLNPDAVSPAGAKGVMQLTDPTAAQYGVANSFDPAANIDAGVHYLAQLLGQYRDLPKALAAYNWGPGNLNRAISAYGDAWLNHAPAETQAYVAAIAGVQPTQGPPAPVPQPPLTIDASTGEVIPDTTDVSQLSPATGATPQQLVAIAALAVGAFFLADLFLD